MIYLGKSKVGTIYSGADKVDKIYKGEELVYSSAGGGIPDYYVLATDDDFSDTRDGYFTYKGNDEYVIVPKTIKGVTVTMMRDYRNSPLDAMFGKNSSRTVKGIALEEGNNITSLSNMFYNSLLKEVELLYMDISKRTSMYGMFMYSSFTSLDLSSFDMSNVSDVRDMFRSSQAKTGYARTQADANKLNASSYKPSSLKFVVKP